MSKKGSSQLEMLDIDVKQTLDRIAFAAFVTDPKGRICWLNQGAIDLVGDVVGQPFSRVVPPDQMSLARTQLAKKLLGESTDFFLSVIDAGGRRVEVRVSSVPLWDEGRVIGTFGLAYPLRRDGGDEQAHATRPARPAPPTIELTDRQHEVLLLLGRGLGTVEIARRLGVAVETARNHIRALLRQLGAHSRLEAVVIAYRLGLLDPSSQDEN